MTGEHFFIGVLIYCDTGKKEKQLKKGIIIEKNLQNGIKNKNIWKLPHQKLNIRRHSIRKIVMCSWYIKNADSKKNSEMKTNYQKGRYQENPETLREYKKTLFTKKVHKYK